MKYFVRVLGDDFSGRFGEIDRILRELRIEAVFVRLGSGGRCYRVSEADANKLPQRRGLPFFVLTDREFVLGPDDGDKIWNACQKDIEPDLTEWWEKVLPKDGGK